MRKLRVGVWVNGNLKAQLGGEFGYCTQLINALSNRQFKDAEVLFISNSAEIQNLDVKNKYQISWVPYKENKITRIKNFIGKKIKIYPKNIYNQRVSENQQSLKDELNNIVDIIYYPTPICVYPNFPYIYTLWDLGHLSTFAFPEVSMNKVFDHRKEHHATVPHKALLIFAESNAGKKDIGKYLGINEERVRVVPIFPSEIISGKIIPQKPDNIDTETFFILYPAQYWAHKNHYNLLIALNKLIPSYPTIKLVLTGSDKGNKEYIFQLVSEMGINDNVVDLGFVSIEELKWLYIHSQGLVMPSFMGPTNMPLLEAAELGCPVACSNLNGHIEQLGDYGYYFDPKNPENIADVIDTMLTDKKNCVSKPYVSNFNIENAIMSIDQAFTDLQKIRFCWGKKDILL